MECLNISFSHLPPCEVKNPFLPVTDQNCEDIVWLSQQ
jgi:hypothetical protein